MSLAKFHAGATLVRVLAVVACGVALAGCETVASLNPFNRGEVYRPEIVPVTPAGDLYNDGLARIQKGDHSGASRKFGELERQYPGSDWARKGLLMEAYAGYEGKAYDDAITASQRYLQLYPSSDDAAYAHYLLAMSYYNQIPDVTRDQERSERALLALQQLIERYPKSEYAADARRKIQVARDQLAGREMEIGRFYLSKRNYTGAINRFRNVVSNYQTTRHVEEALQRLTEAYMAMGIVAEAQTAAAVLGHNFPDSVWYKESYALLTRGGVQPYENSESWISKAFRGVPRVGQQAG
jgi:outer membrane protein assembly factor BamD